MEEKERYSYDYFIDGAVFIDTENDRDMDMDTVCSLLNKQDQQIADLEAKLAESESKRKGLEEKVKFLTEEKEENFVDGQKYNELKQQLKDQARKAYQEGLLQKQFDKDMEIQELKDKIEFLTTFKEVISEHKPAFCKLAGRDCEWLGKEKQLAIEVLTMFEAILSRAIQWDNNYKCWTISEEVFGNIIMQIDEKIEELKGEE